MKALTDQVGDVFASIFENPLVQLVLTGAVAYLVLVWLASAYWVFGDMRRRHRDPMPPFLAATGIVLASPVLFPLALIVYRIVRPGETMTELRERELTERLEAAEAEQALGCPGCGRLVEEDWLACPACRTRLAHRCARCDRAMGLDWTLCAWCGAEFGRPILPEGLPGAVRRAGQRERDRGFGEGARLEPQLLEPGA